jgi:soluble lytic murein transglycosylase-like protein
MERHRTRASLAVLATALFLAISLSSTPSNSTPSNSTFSDSIFSNTTLPNLHQKTAEEEAAEMQELARWMVSGGRSESGRFQAIRPEDFAAATTSERREVSLFAPGAPADTEADAAARRRFLDAMPYGSAISLAAERHQVDGLLMAAIVAVESRFTPEAVSPRGARGLMQIRPAVGAAYGAKDLSDPYTNVDVGSRYFSSLMKDYQGNLELTLAAYNAGPAAVARYGGVPPYRETRAYVRKVTALYQEYSRRAGGSSGRLAEVRRSVAGS